MWRSQLADKKALLILDNAASYGQFEPLLPGGSGCLVLVTSRRRLAAYEEVVLPVGSLPPEHAIDLFVRLSGRPAASLDRVVLEQLVALCGDLYAPDQLIAPAENASALGFPPGIPAVSGRQQRPGDVGYPLCGALEPEADAPSASSL